MPLTTTRPIRFISEAQVRFITTLDAERETGHFAEDTLADLEAVRAGDPILMSHASGLISVLKAAPRKATKASPAGAVQDGIYRDPATNEIYKVQEARQGSGRLYAKRLNQPEGEVRGTDWSWEYVAGLVRRIRPEWRLSLEEAQAFGRLYGVCIRCGAALTDEESIERGIGPVCASRF